MRITISIMLTALALTAVTAAPAHAAEYWSSADMLREFFANSERVTYVRLETETARRELIEHLGDLPDRPSYVVYMATTKDHIDGYAVIDDEMGQHQPITFAVKITPEGDIARTEIMAYRECYGGEVRQSRFTRQFTGKSTTNRLEDEIMAISGATISSNAMTMGIRRALALVSIVRTRQANTLAQVSRELVTATR